MQGPLEVRLTSPIQGGLSRWAKPIASHSVAGVVPWLELLPDLFASYTALKAASFWHGDTVWVDSRSGADNGLLDTTVGYSPAGLTKSIRLDFQDQTADSADRCTDYYPTQLNLDLPSSVSEVWVEIIVKFTSAFVTTVPGGWGCGSANSYKLLAGRVTPSGQFMMTVGDNSNGAGTSQFYPGSAEQNGPDESLFDGNWHVIRFHWKCSSSGAGLHVVMLDGTTIVNLTGLTMPVSTVIYGLGLGRNLNHGPAALQSLYWGRVRAYNTDPGWGI